jgi:hypothetical protein
MESRIVVITPKEGAQANKRGSHLTVHKGISLTHSFVYFFHCVYRGQIGTSTHFYLVNFHPFLEDFILFNEV